MKIVLYTLIEKFFFVSKLSSSSDQKLFRKLNSLYLFTCISLIKSQIFNLIHDKKIWQQQTTRRC